MPLTIGESRHSERISISVSQLSQLTFTPLPLILSFIVFFHYLLYIIYITVIVVVAETAIVRDSCLHSIQARIQAEEEASAVQKPDSDQELVATAARLVDGAVDRSLR